MPIDLNFFDARMRGMIITLIVIAILYFGRDILIPIALAILISFVLAPLVRLVERIHIGRVASVITVLVICGLLLIVSLWSFGSQMIELGENLPTYKTNLVSRINDLKHLTPRRFISAQNALEEIVEDKENSVRDVAVANYAETITDDSQNSKDSSKTKPEIARMSSANWLDRLFPSPSKTESNDDQPIQVSVVRDQVTSLGQVLGLINPMLGPIGTIGIVIVLTIFVLLDREDFRNRIVQLFGSSNLAITTKAMTEASERSVTWLRTMFFINALYGMALTIGLLCFGVPSAILWGALGFFCRFLPYVGPWIGAAIPIGLSFGVFEGWLIPLSIIALYVGLELIVNMILEPWLYGRSLGLTSIGIIIAIVFWTSIWGPVGLLVAIPVTLWLVVLGHHIPQMSQFTLLFGDLSEMPSYHSLYQRLLAYDQVEANTILDRYFTEDSPETILEKVLLPLFARLNLDLKAGFIDEAQAEFVFRTIAENIEESADEIATSTANRSEFEQGEFELNPTRSANSEMRLLVVPAGGEPEKIVAGMLRLLILKKLNTDAEICGAELLASEIVSKIESTQHDLVVLSCCTVNGHNKIRSICKRLARAPVNVPVLVMQPNFAPTYVLPIIQKVEVFSSTDKLIDAIGSRVPLPQQV